MRTSFSFHHLSSCYFSLTLVALFHVCFSNQNFADGLCMDDERQALLRFKHGLIGGVDRLASWVPEDNDCCKWAGIVCDNFTGHVHHIHLRGHCHADGYSTSKEYEQASKQILRGDISPSLLHLKQLKHLDLSCNDFGGIQIPRFIGSFQNLRYLNLSLSRFGGTIPPQLGNLSELRVLCLGNFHHVDGYERTSMLNMHWLSSHRWLLHLDMSGVDLSKATDWFQVINNLPSLVELHISNSKLLNMYPQVGSNVTSLSVLDLSRNRLSSSFGLQWIFSISNLVSLDLGGCNFQSPIPKHSFRNLTSLKHFRVSGNDFMNSSLVLEEFSSTVGGNMVSLDISSCGVSSSILNSLHNLTSLLSLDISANHLTKPIPKSLGDFCSLRHVDLGYNNFVDVSLTHLLGFFFECQSPSLESLSLRSSELSSHLPDQFGQLMHLVDLQLRNNCIIGVIPDSIGRLSFLRSLDLENNLISGPLPYSIGGLSSLEFLYLSSNRLNGGLPDSLSLLSNLISLDISSNLLSGVVTEAHFVKLVSLKYLIGFDNNLILRPHNASWIPSFQLLALIIGSWDLGPQFPLWLLLQRDLIDLEISNTKISSTMPESFWRSLPNLEYLDMSQNNIQGSLSGIPAQLRVLDLSSNEFSSQLHQLPNNSLLATLDLSNNSFGGSLYQLLCPYSEKSLEKLNVADNNLSGVIPECWVKWPWLLSLNLGNNNFFGKIPRTLGSLSSLYSLNMYNNKLSGRLPVSIKKLTDLKILQLAKNELIGRIPSWIGRELANLKIINLRSNSFYGNLSYELCYLINIQILDLSNNNLSGNIPRCFHNFSVLSGTKTLSSGELWWLNLDDANVVDSASLVIKGREDTYDTILRLVMALDLSSNKFYGQIPSELMTLRALRSLNLSGNQLTGRIPEKIGDLKSLESLDVSMNQLSGELPVSLATLNFLSVFNASFNNLTGKIPSSTQLQGFNESSFLGNKLCGYPLTQRCEEVVPNRDQEEGEHSDRVDWGLIISILSGLVVGFWIVVAPLIVGRMRRFAPFRFVSNLTYMLYDLTR